LSQTLRSTAAAAHISREVALQRVLTAWIVTGLLFMLIPRTLLGVWNLVSISGSRSAGSISPAWTQAHGHAQLFGWIGSFIIGIGFYSLSKMAKLESFHICRAWLSRGLWTAGVALRWATNLYAWHWHELLPASAVMELAAFAIFFRTVSRHQSEPKAAAEHPVRPVWVWLVMGSTVGFFATLPANLAAVVWLVLHNSQPAVPHALDQRFLTIGLWAFIVPAIWGFSARWLPVFLGLPQPSEMLLRVVYLLALSGMIAGLFGAWPWSSVLAKLAKLV
jgi:hypothetical protein